MQIRIIVSFKNIFKFMRQFIITIKIFLYNLRLSYINVLTSASLIVQQVQLTKTIQKNKHVQFLVPVDY